MVLFGERIRDPAWSIFLFSWELKNVNMRRFILLWKLELDCSGEKIISTFVGEYIISCEASEMDEEV
jgi:hypothetical protein